MPERSSGHDVMRPKLKFQVIKLSDLSLIGHIEGEAARVLPGKPFVRQATFVYNGCVPFATVSHCDRRGFITCVNWKRVDGAYLPYVWRAALADVHWREAGPKNEIHSARCPAGEWRNAAVKSKNVARACRMWSLIFGFSGFSAGMGLAYLQNMEGAKAKVKRPTADLGIHLQTYRLRPELAEVALGSTAAVASDLVPNVMATPRRPELAEISLRDATAVASDLVPNIMISQLVRKNSRKTIDEAYTLMTEAPLGEGAFGVVYRGVHNGTQIERAIKKIDKSTTPDVGMLAREIASQRLMDHPGVCRLVEYFESTRYLWLVTELCRGGDLCDRLETFHEGLSEAEAAGQLKQILKAVLHCHTQAIVHRDLKPENFLYKEANSSPLAQREVFNAGKATGPTDHLKLIDFGFAVNSKLPVAETICGSMEFSVPEEAPDVAGTILYMSPEALAGETPNSRHDMWSCGVMFYILLTGQFPFSTNDDDVFQELFDKGQLEADVKAKLDELLVSPHAADLLRRFLQYKGEDRITADVALRHPFFGSGSHSATARANADVTKSFEGMEDVRARLLRFSATCRLRRVASAAVVRLFDADRNDQYWSDARAAFNSLDQSGSGKISVEELAVFLASPMHKRANKTKEATGHLGGVEYSAFLAAAVGEEALCSDERMLRNVFELLDADRDEAISSADLQKRLGLSLETSLEFIREALAELRAQREGCGEVDLNSAESLKYFDFNRLMRGAR